MENLHLLAVPDLVRTHILSFLTIPEQLKLRLVCKTTKSWIDSTSSRLAEHIPRTYISYHGRETFRRLCDGPSRIPHMISTVFLESVSLSVYEDNKTVEFLRRYWKSITSLHVKRYFICNNNRSQIRFFDALDSLNSLEVDEIWIANSDIMEEAKACRFKNVKILKLGRIHIFDEVTNEIIQSFASISESRIRVFRACVWDLVDACTNLDFLRVPVSPKYILDDLEFDCARLGHFFNARARRAHPARLRPLQCDLNYLRGYRMSIELLLIIGSRVKVLFHNVNTKVYRNGIGPFAAQKNSIYSFVSTYLVNKTFIGVQQLVIKASLIQNECIVGREKGPQLLPSLKEIEIIIDIGFDKRRPLALYSSTFNNVCFPRADQVLRFFFPGNSTYACVKALSITYKDPVFPDQKPANTVGFMTLPFIIACLPKLQKLRIVGWDVSPETYKMLWTGFNHLKVLTIQSCYSLNASCFMGGNGGANNPDNYNLLPELEFLELNNLEDMPGFTSRRGLGMKVFSRMGLVHSPFLCYQGKARETAVWMRTNASIDPPSMENSTIITRSITNSRREKRMKLN